MMNNTNNKPPHTQIKWIIYKLSKFCCVHVRGTAILLLAFNIFIGNGEGLNYPPYGHQCHYHLVNCLIFSLEGILLGFVFKCIVLPMDLFLYTK